MAKPSQRPQNVGDLFSAVFVFLNCAAMALASSGLPAAASAAIA
jgi:hypothetical protein